MKMLALAIILLSFPWLSHADDDDRYDGHHHKHNRHNNFYFWQNVEKREYKYQKRIDKGIYTGMLTRKEVRQLKREHKHLDKQIKHFKRHRYLSKMEKKNVMEHLSHYSKKIRYLKHNDRYAHRHNHQQYTHYNNRGNYNKPYISSARNEYSVGLYYNF